MNAPNRLPGRFRREARRLIRWSAARVNRVHAIRRTGRSTYPDADFSLHMLLCHEAIDMALWALKSFSYATRCSPTTVIHDDGTLTEQDSALLERHLARATVISRRTADSRAAQALFAHPRCLAMRQSPNFICALKLFDPWIFSASDRVVLLDSDILFFHRPDELLNCVNKGVACFNSDYQDAYSAPANAIFAALGSMPLPRVNAGLVAMNRKSFDLDLIERYFTAFPSPIPCLDRHEQTLYAILLGKANAQRLSGAYQISKQPIHAATVSHHFVNDGSRLHFSTRGVVTLTNRGVLDALSREYAQHRELALPRDHPQWP
jgi:hypothetical protein